jgi:hypothetical protein
MKPFAIGMPKCLSGKAGQAKARNLFFYNGLENGQTKVKNPSQITVETNREIFHTSLTMRLILVM